MKTEPKPRLMTALVWALRLWLAGLAVFSLLVQPVYTTKGLLVGAAVGGLMVSAGFAVIPTTRPRTLMTAEAIILSSFLLHVMGHALGLYAKISFYDKILHVLIPAAIAYALYALSQSTKWLWEWTRVRPVETGIYLFCILVSLGVVWEIFEFSTDVLMGTHEQGGNTDTMMDLIADAGGAFAGAVIAASLTAYGRRHGFQAVSEETKPVSRRLGRDPPRA